MTNPTVPELALGWRMLLARAAILAVAWQSRSRLGTSGESSMSADAPLLEVVSVKPYKSLNPGAGICGTRHSCGAGD